MPSVLVRNLPEKTHRALKLRAAKHGRSTGAKILEILESVVRPSEPVRLGSELAALGRQFGSVDLRIERNTIPADQVRTIEQENGSADETRRKMIEAIQTRYTLAA